MLPGVCANVSQMDTPLPCPPCQCHRAHQPKRFVYRGVDGHIYDFFYVTAASAWTAPNDVSPSGAASAAGDPVAYVTDFPGQGPIARILYRDVNGGIFEYFNGPATSGTAELTALGGGPPAAGNPSIYVTDFADQGPTAHFVYRGVDSHVYDLFYIAATAPESAN
jgi:hypothetical protein